MLSPANEAPPLTNLNAQAAGSLTVDVIRGEDGQAAAGLVTFNVNPRFPGRVEFTGLHVHDGKAGENGGVTIGTSLSGSNPVLLESGGGNIFLPVLVTGGAALRTLNSMLQNPENHYVNLHSRDNPSGAVRAQVMAANTAAPAVVAAISAVSDVNLRTVAPGGLMTIFGTNLTKVAADLSGWTGENVPTSLNGVSVMVGGTAAPILWATPGYIVAQVPVNAQAGLQPVVVRTPNGQAQTGVTVAATAPAIFFDGVGGTVVKNSDFSLLRPENRAEPGEIIVIYGTGLGRTTAPLATGQITPFGDLYNTQPVTVTIGGQEAPVIYSLASPGYLGLNQVAVRVPQGLSGALPLVVRSGSTTSNSVTIFVR
jgi:uncharacterized protein (TIGR03437 family)